MRRVLNSLFIGSLSLLWCGLAVGSEVSASMLLYHKAEAGVEPYPSRILVTDRFMRMDEGSNDGNYVLFDREKRHIYSITHEERTIFEIPKRAVQIEPPDELRREQEEVTAQNVPQVAGKQPRRFRLSVNGQLCYNVIAVDGVMEQAVTALREFRLVLAGEHAKALLFMPADMRNPCDMALHTFHPGWLLEFGLPIHEWDEMGNSQSLRDFRPAVAVDVRLFELPAGYRQYSTDAR